MCVLGRHDLDVHDRLEQHGSGLAHAVLEAPRAGDLERHLGRIDAAVRAVEQRDLHVDHGIARDARRSRLCSRTPLSTRRHELARHDAAGDRVDEFVALARGPRLDARATRAPYWLAAAGLRA